MAKFTYDHIHLRSPNPEATAAFYERMFGAEVIRTMQQGKPRIDMKIGGARRLHRAGAARWKDQSAAGNALPGPRSLRALGHGHRCRRCRAQGQGRRVHHGADHIRPGVRIAFLRGPEGVSIELLERKPA